jgi:replicative DNA helicase
MSIYTDLLKQYEAAASILAGKVLEEPYNFHQIAGLITSGILNTEGMAGAIITAAANQFKEKREYSVHTIAKAMHIETGYLLALTDKDHGLDTRTAFSFLADIYGQRVELEIAQHVEGLVYQGDTSEQIKIKCDQKRKESGLIQLNVSSDGKQEFEEELNSALQGIVVDYPIKPPIKAMRQIIKHHEPGEYIVIGGRTGMGKSFIGLNYIYEASQKNIPSCYINLENTPKNIQKRIWQMHTNIKYDFDLSGLSDSQMTRATTGWDEVKKMPFKTHHTGRSVQTILNTIRQDYYERGIQLAVIDYIQLMKDNTIKGNRAAEIQEISAEVRSLCLDLKIPLIALAQIGREAERSTSKRPGLSDLKGSGGLEEDAATVLLLFRPSYYDIDSDENGNRYADNYADIHVCKGRDVGTGLVECRFDPVRGFFDKEDTTPSFQPAIPFTIPNNLKKYDRNQEVPF